MNIDVSCGFNHTQRLTKLRNPGRKLDIKLIPVAAHDWEFGMAAMVCRRIKQSNHEMALRPDSQNEGEMRKYPCLSDVQTALKALLDC